MEQLEQTMQIYHTIYIGCLVVTLLFLTITIILIVRWRIWETTGILSEKVVTKGALGHKGKQEKSEKKAKRSQKLKSRADMVTEKLWYREAQNRTVLLQQQQEETVLLDAANQQNFGKTEYLQESQPMQEDEWQMQILDEIKKIHSKETIP